MIHVKFQSPTQGPLITVTFDDMDDGDVFTSLLVGGVPGLQLLREIANGTRLPMPLSSAASRLVVARAGLFARFAPYIIPLICAGDTPVRPASVATREPVPEAVLNPEGVHIASDVTQLTDDLARQVVASDILSPDQKYFLERLMALVRAGHKDLNSLLENIWKMMVDDLLRRAEGLGASAQSVALDGNCYTRIHYGSDTAELHQLLAPLLSALLGLQLRVPGLPAMVNVDGVKTTLHLPTWRTFVALYLPHMAGIEWIARTLDMDETIAMYARGRAHVQIEVGQLLKWSNDLNASVHPVVFMLLELFHALSVQRLTSEQEVTRSLLNRLAGVDSQYAAALLDRVVAVADDLALPKTDQQLIDTLWEIMELDLALRAMKAGAAVEITDGRLRIVAASTNREIEALMNPVLKAMQAMRTKGMTVIHASLAKKTWTFDLDRWSKNQSKVRSRLGVSLEDYADVLREDMEAIKSSAVPHALARAWETVEGLLEL